MELVFIIIMVLIGLVVGITTAVSFIKQPYQSDETQRQQREAIHRAHEALQQFERAALNIRQREEDLLHVLAENPQGKEDVQHVLHQHNETLRRKIETLEKQEEELRRTLDVLQEPERMHSKHLLPKKNCEGKSDNL